LLNINKPQKMTGKSLIVNRWKIIF
jgi:hypothetical protein